MPETMKQKILELMMKNVDEPINIEVDLSNSTSTGTVTGPVSTTVTKVPSTKVVPRKRYKADTSTKPKLSTEQKRKIGTKEFWEKVQEKLVSRIGVKTIYVPFLSDGLIVDSHGFFDLIDSAITGSVDLISGRKVTKKTLGKRYSAKGKLMVSNDEEGMDHPDRWRAIDFKKMIGHRTYVSLRMEIYKLLSNKVDYGILMGNYGWPTSSSMTKIKVMKFCHIERPYKTLTNDCYFLTSRQIVGKSLGTINGVPFR